jgi:integrase/recombinase (xerC/xerD family); CF-10 family
MGRKTKMNSITSPELLAQVNPDNIQLLNDFLNYLQSVAKSETTIRGYENDIQIAWVWCLQHNKNTFFINWTKRNIVAYQNWLLSNNKNSASRVRRLKAALSSLSNYIEDVLDDEYPDFRNIINKIKNPVNQTVRTKTVWEDDEIEGLLDKLTCNGQFEKACYLALAAYSGRRKSELCRFKVSDFSKDKLVCNGALYKSDPIKTKGQGGGKMLPCYTLAKKFDPYLDAWLEYRKQNNIQSEWVFPDAKDASKHVSISTINSWSNTFSRLSGKPAYMHSFRHYFTTNLVRSGFSENAITKIIGWESTDMCRVYTDIDTEEQIGVYFEDGEIVAPKKKSFSEI